MNAWLEHGLATVFIVGASLLAYDRLVVRPAQVIGVVDVGEVFKLKETEFTQRMTRSATEEERQQALFLARQFAQRLPLALEALPRECRCVVLVRTALAGRPDNAIDLTPLLEHKVNTP